MAYVKIWIDEHDEVLEGFKPTGEKEWGGASWGYAYEGEVLDTEIKQVSYGECIYFDGKDYPIERLKYPVIEHEINGVKMFTQGWFNASLMRRQVTIAGDYLPDGSYFFVQAFYDKNGFIQPTENALDGSDKYKSIQPGNEKEFDAFLSNVEALIKLMNVQMGKPAVLVA